MSNMSVKLEVCDCEPSLQKPHTLDTENHDTDLQTCSIKHELNEMTEDDDAISVKTEQHEDVNNFEIKTVKPCPCSGRTLDHSSISVEPSIQNPHTSNTEKYDTILHTCSTKHELN